MEQKKNKMLYNTWMNLRHLFISYSSSILFKYYYYYHHYYFVVLKFELRALCNPLPLEPHL
jgi:hypothetical protein